MTTIDRIPVDQLDIAALFVEPRTRDWSKDYPEDWDYVAAPTCQSCGDYAEWVSGEDLSTRDGLTPPWPTGDPPDITTETWEAWRCPDPECENFGCEIEDEGDSGPMMNYSYELPFFEDDPHEAASKIADLPLCIIIDSSEGMFAPSDSDYSLALTGGGMDLTWEIAEAYTRLGFLPPFAYCRLPAMCGRGTLSNSGKYGGQELSERDAYLIDACRHSAQAYVEFANSRAQSTLEHLGEL